MVHKKVQLLQLYLMPAGSKDSIWSPEQEVVIYPVASVVRVAL